MIGCQRARRQMWVCSEGHPPTPWLAAHLRRCPRCAAEAQRLAREAFVLQEAAPPTPYPDPDRLWARIEPQLPRPRRAWLPGLAPVAGAALLAALLLPGRPQRVSGPTPPPTQTAPPTAPVTAAAPPVVAAAPPPARPKPAPPVARQVARAPRPTRPKHARTAGARKHPAPPTASAPESMPPSPPAAPETVPVAPLAAVVVVHPAPSAALPTSADSVSFFHSETADPVSGSVTRLAVSRQADATGRARHVTIEYEVRPAAAVTLGAASET